MLASNIDLLAVIYNHLLKYEPASGKHVNTSKVDLIDLTIYNINCAAQFLTLKGKFILKSLYNM